MNPNQQKLFIAIVFLALMLVLLFLIAKKPVENKNEADTLQPTPTEVVVNPSQITGDPATP